MHLPLSQFMHGAVQQEDWGVFGGEREGEKTLPRLLHRTRFPALGVIER